MAKEYPGVAPYWAEERARLLTAMEANPSSCKVFNQAQIDLGTDSNMEGEYGIATLRLLAAIHAPICPKGPTAHGMGNL